MWVFFYACAVNVWNSSPNSVVDAYQKSFGSTKQLNYFDFTAHVTGTGNRSEEVIK